MKISDMSGKTVEYAAWPSLQDALAEFSKPGEFPVFFAAHGDAALQDLRSLPPETTSVFAVYEGANQHWIRTHYPPRIAALFGGIGTMLTLPKIRWESHFEGATQYIDGIRSDDLDEHPVMLGVDNYARPFVVFCAEHQVQGKKAAVVLFQRYSDSAQTWAFAGHGPLSGSLHCENTAAMERLFGSDGYHGWRAGLN